MAHEHDKEDQQKEQNHNSKEHEHDDHSSHEQHSEHSDHSGHNHHEMMLKEFRTKFWISLALTIPIIILAPLIQNIFGYELRFQGDRYVQLIISSVIFFYGGMPFLKGLWSEIKDKAPGMMTLIGLAIIVAYAYSTAVVLGLEGKIFFWELATLIVIMLLGHWFEMRSVMKASNALDELAKLMPTEAIRIDNDGNKEKVDVSDLNEDDLILVKPGEKIPADGNVSDGESSVNESMITGESKPVRKKKDDEVIGGSINEEGSLEVSVKHTGDDAYLSKVVKMVEEAQEKKSKSQDIANKAAGWLFYVALGTGLITMVTWLYLGKDFVFSLERMVTVMVISCPHALGLAVPLVASISTTISAKNGILIRNRTAFENSRKITLMIFDKTGTLTKGEFAVKEFVSLSDKADDKEILALAASIEDRSEHPLGAAIIKKAKELDLDLKDVKDFNSITGKGIEGNIDEKTYRVVSPDYLKEKDIEIPDDQLEDSNGTIVYVLESDELIGAVRLEDEIREESFEAVRTLKDRGIKVIMATGDNENVAKSVSKELELDDYYSGVLPDAKQDLIRKFQDEGEVVAMTGDGVNDAPALAQADIGIAVGSGTDVAAETADIILVNSDPKDISSMIIFGNETYKKVVQNLFWAAGYNIFALPLAAGVLAGEGIILSPAVGALLMSLSTIIVAVNAQLLRRKA